MERWMWLMLGVEIGMFMNSRRGADFGGRFGKWCRRIFIERGK
jgi:hypothetical protein